MAVIYKNLQGISNSVDFNAIQPFVNNYWGGANREKSFPLPFWKMQEMMAVSGEVALRVREINNPSFVRAEWIVFSNDMEGILNDPVRANEYYFVLDESDFIRLGENIPILTNPLNNIVIVGRLGKPEPDSATYHAFIIAANCMPIPPGAGGDGVIAGAKIPPPQP